MKNFTEKLENLYTPTYVDFDLHNGKGHYHSVKFSFVACCETAKAVKWVDFIML